MSKRLAIVVNSSWNLHNFRRGLILAFAGAGYEVFLCGPADGKQDVLADLPATFLPLRHMNRRSLNPFSGLLLIRELYRLYRRNGIDYALLFSAKPVVFGALAARRAGVKHLATLTGLGYMFVRSSLASRFMKLLYRGALSRAEGVVYHNPDDRDLLLAAGVGRPERSYVVGGSGVPLGRFPYTPYDGAQPGRFLFVGRLLVDKGIREFAAAARMARQYDASLSFHVIGGLDPGNPSSITQAEVDRWQREGDLTYAGELADVRPALAGASVVVLPSYREGCPRSLLEAAATGRALIGGDAPGVREVVLPGRTGWLVPIRDAEVLKRTMLAAAAAGPEVLAGLGKGGRKLVEHRFSERVVVAEYLRLVSGKGG